MIFSAASLPRDHPRRCGENLAMRARCPPPRGSPPQVRGKRTIKFFAFGGRRITPAGAGKTHRQVTGKLSARDHPRRCGENLLTYGYNSSNMGSPPQVRGKRTCSFVMPAASRITPAGAGKTLSVRLAPSAFQDHPRRCGENRLKLRTIAAVKNLCQDHPRRCGENCSVN